MSRNEGDIHVLARCVCHWRRVREGTANAPIKFSLPEHFSNELQN